MVVDKYPIISKNGNKYYVKIYETVEGPSEQRCVSLYERKTKNTIFKNKTVDNLLFEKIYNYYKPDTTYTLLNYIEMVKDIVESFEESLKKKV